MVWEWLRSGGLHSGPRSPGIHRERSTVVGWRTASRAQPNGVSPRRLIEFPEAGIARVNETMRLCARKATIVTALTGRGKRQSRRSLRSPRSGGTACCGDGAQQRSNWSPWAASGHGGTTVEPRGGRRPAKSENGATLHQHQGEHAEDENDDGGQGHSRAQTGTAEEHDHARLYQRIAGGGNGDRPHRHPVLTGLSRMIRH